MRIYGKKAELLGEREMIDMREREGGRERSQYVKERWMHNFNKEILFLKKSLLHHITAKLKGQPGF